MRSSGDATHSSPTKTDRHPASAAALAGSPAAGPRTASKIVTATVDDGATTTKRVEVTRLNTSAARHHVPERKTGRRQC
jgi:hypothetical protein